MYGTLAFAFIVAFGGLITWLMYKCVLDLHHTVIMDCILYRRALNFRQMKLNNELNNMSWRVRPEEILLEVGRLFGSKVGLQQLNVDVRYNNVLAT